MAVDQDWQYTRQVQSDGTEAGIANRLFELGISKQDITLAFHDPHVRQVTGFGTSKPMAG